MKTQQLTAKESLEAFFIEIRQSFNGPNGNLICETADKHFREKLEHLDKFKELAKTIRDFVVLKEKL